MNYEVNINETNNYVEFHARQWSDFIVSFKKGN